MGDFQPHVLKKKVLIKIVHERKNGDASFSVVNSKQSCRQSHTYLIYSLSQLTISYNNISVKGQLGAVFSNTGVQRSDFSVEKCLTLRYLYAAFLFYLLTHFAINDRDSHTDRQYSEKSNVISRLQVRLPDVIIKKI